MYDLDTFMICLQPVYDALVGVVENDKEKVKAALYAVAETLENMKKSLSRMHGLVFCLQILISFKH